MRTRHCALLSQTRQWRSLYSLSSILRIYCLQHQWNFDMKAHIGVDARSGLVHYLHNLHSTPSNTADVMILLG